MDAVIKLSLAPTAKKTATGEVEEVLANLDATNPSKQLFDLIDKRTQAGLAKIKQNKKRDLQKKTIWWAPKPRSPRPPQMDTTQEKHQPSPLPGSKSRNRKRR